MAETLSTFFMKVQVVEEIFVKLSGTNQERAITILESSIKKLQTLLGSTINISSNCEQHENQSNSFEDKHVDGVEGGQSISDQKIILDENEKVKNNIDKNEISPITRKFLMKHSIKSILESKSPTFHNSIPSEKTSPLKERAKKTSKVKVTQSKRDQHEDLPIKRRVLVCYETNATLTHPRAIRSHIKSHPGQPMSCLKCRKELKNFCDFCFHECDQNVLKFIAKGKKKKHTCSDCGVTFKLLKSLKRHLHNLHSPNLKCSECEETFTKKSDLKEHSKIHSKMVCMVCGEVCKDLNIFTEHMNKHSSDSLGDKNEHVEHTNEHYENTEDNSEEYWYSNEQNEHSNGEYTNEHQEYATEQQQYITEHQEYSNEHGEHPNELYQYSAEHYQYPNQQNVYSNQQYEISNEFETQQNEYREYKCNKCSQYFSSDAQLNEHRCEHSDYSDKSSICDVCGKLFSQPGLLVIHQRIHTGEKPLECSVCKLAFRTKRALLKHTETFKHCEKAGIKQDKKFTCSTCGKSFYRKQTLKRHLKCHSGERSHMCQYCGYKAIELNNLKRHVLHHFKGQRNFICELCGDAFHTKKTLESHNKHKHNDERNYACTECEMMFKSRSGLNRHEKTHSKVKEHKCWCEAAFGRLSNLRRHMKSVHGSDSTLPPVRKIAVMDEVDPAEEMEKTMVESEKYDETQITHNLHDQSMMSNCLQMTDVTYQQTHHQTMSSHMTLDTQGMVYDNMASTQHAQSLVGYPSTQLVGIEHQRTTDYFHNNMNMMDNMATTQDYSNSCMYIQNVLLPSVAGLLDLSHSGK